MIDDADVELHTGEEVRWTKARVEEFLALFSINKTFSEIARAMGISRNAAIAKAWRMNLSRGGKRVHPRMVEETEKDQRIRDRRVEKAPITLVDTTTGKRKSRDTWGTRKVRLKSTTAPPSRVILDHPLATLNGGCKWPVGEPDRPDFHYCGGHRVDIETPYCPEHYAVAYKPYVRRT